MQHPQTMTEFEEQFKEEMNLEKREADVITPSDFNKIKQFLIQI